MSEKMKYKRLNENLLYDGSPVEPFWAFKEFKTKGSSIIAWIGPMNIKSEQLIDYEDTGLQIKSDEMVHFIVEHFDVQPADIRTCYHRQRLFVLIVKDALAELGIETKRSGDDIYFKDKKLSVSIATCSNSSMKIHFGMNVHDKGTPKDIETIGLLECKEDMDLKEIHVLMDTLAESYINEIQSIEEDITKTRVF